MARILTEKQIQKDLLRLPGWKRRGDAIYRLYAFSGFIGAIAFVNHVAGLAEAMDHHPDIVVKFRRVTLTLSTHSAGGLTALDFALAQKIDA